MASPPNEDDGEDFDDDDDDDEVGDETEASRPCAVASQVKYKMNWGFVTTVMVWPQTFFELCTWKLAFKICQEYAKQEFSLKKLLKCPYHSSSHAVFPVLSILV